MFGGFQAEYGNVAALLAGAMMLALAAFLLILRFSDRLHQSFALLLVLSGLYRGSVGWDTGVGTPANSLRVYLVLAIPFAAAGFALRYSSTHGKIGARWLRLGATWVFLVGAVVVEWLYLVDHARFWSLDEPQTGPLHLFFSIASVVFAVIAVQFMRDHRQTAPGRRRRSFFLAALGFSFEPLFTAVFHVLGPAGDYVWGSSHDTGHLSEPFLFWTDVLQVVPLVILAVAAAVFLRRGPDAQAPGRRAEKRALLLSWCLFAALAVADSLQLRWRGADGAQLHRLFLALPPALGTALITYAIAKHQLFDIEVRVRWAIKQSTVSGVFVAVFFIVAKLSESWAERIFGSRWIVGAIAAGLMLFALAPLQRMAERVAAGAIPAKQPDTLAHQERLDIYREQLEIAWSDGSLTRKERLRFEKLRQRLQIPPQVALTLEAAVVADPPRPASSA